MNKIQKLYEDLLKKHGHQGWWPVTPEKSPQQKLRSKNLPHRTSQLGSVPPLADYGDIPKPIYGLKSSSEKQKLEIIFGAILTQNTSWKNVEKAIIELNNKQIIDIKKILKIKQDILAETIKSSGYYNQKAKKLKNICEFLKKISNKNFRKYGIDQIKRIIVKC